MFRLLYMKTITGKLPYLAVTGAKGKAKYRPVVNIRRYNTLFHFTGETPGWPGSVQNTIGAA